MSHLDHMDLQSLEKVISKMFDISWVKFCLISVLSVWASMFKGQHAIMAIIPLLIVIDALTGFIAAYMKKDISSGEFHKTLLKAFVYFIFILVARAVDYVTPGDYFTYLTNFFVVSTEAISIMENIAKMGFPVPTMFIHRLRDFQKNIK